MKCDDNWKNKLFDFLLENKDESLFNGMIICNMGHPIIHIGKAIELDLRITGVEALTQTAVCYNPLHEFIDKLEIPKPGSKSALQIFQDV